MTFAAPASLALVPPRKRCDVSTSLRAVGAITLFVDDPGRSAAFYETVFAAPRVHEDGDAVAFGFGELVVNLLRRPAARELVEPADVAAADAGASFQLTVWVEDADGACNELREKGVELLNGPHDRPWGVRTAAFADPDGHVWEIAQSLSAAAS
jgi:lactoylglutathione lyase